MSFNKTTSPENSQGVLFWDRVPASSSDFNEFQTVFNNKFQTLNDNIKLTYSMDGSTLTLTSINIKNKVVAKLNGISITLSSKVCQLYIFTRDILLEDPKAPVYLYGLRSNTQFTITGADTPTENNLIPVILDQQVSSRELTEWTCIAVENGANAPTLDGWTVEGVLTVSYGSNSGNGVAQSNSDTDIHQSAVDYILTGTATLSNSGLNNPSNSWSGNCTVLNLNDTDGDYNIYKWNTDSSTWEVIDSVLKPGVLIFTASLLTNTSAVSTSNRKMASAYIYELDGSFTSKILEFSSGGDVPSSKGFITNPVYINGGKFQECFNVAFGNAVHESTLLGSGSSQGMHYPDHASYEKCVALGSWTLGGAYNWTGISSTIKFRFLDLVAIGYEAGKYPSGFGGQYSTIIGSQASPYIGNEEVIIGAKAGPRESEYHINNVIIGFNTASYDKGTNGGLTILEDSTIIGCRSFSVLDTNANVAYATILGGYALNHYKGGRVSYNNPIYVTAIGSYAGYLMETGSDSTLIGNNAGKNIIKSNQDVIIGQNAFACRPKPADTPDGEAGEYDYNTGSNVVIGYNAMANVHTPQIVSSNVVIGSRAYEHYGDLDSRPALGNSIVIGASAGRNIYDGTNNILIGGAAGGATVPSGTTSNKTSCDYLLAIGSFALNKYSPTTEFSVDSSKNGIIAIGPYALSDYASPQYSITAAQTAGTIAIGATAGMKISKGSQLTIIGNQAASTVSATSEFNKSICLGANSTISASNQITLGDSTITSLRCQVTSISSLSDSRVKEDVKLADTSLCLKDVERLPVSRFKYKDFTGTHLDTHVTGFMADDYEVVFPKGVSKTDESYPVLDEDGNQLYDEVIESGIDPHTDEPIEEVKRVPRMFTLKDVKSITPTEALPTLWGAVQELVKLVKSQDARIKELESR